MCEPEGSSRNDLYVLGRAFKEAVWLNEEVDDRWLSHSVTQAPRV